jgi:AAA ATPase domain
MTRYLFIDNFRGFTNAYIPLADVNFFVGENSSGKTSVLGLLKLLSTTQFTWYQKFTDEGVDFGHFHDMVSAHSNDRTYFSFGVIDDHPVRGDHGALAMLYTFKEHNGLARLSQFTTVAGRRQIFLKFDGGHWYFKAMPLTKGRDVEDFRNTIFPQWVTERVSDRSDYRQLVAPPGYPKMVGDNSLYLPLMLAVNLAQEKGHHEASALHYQRQELIWIAPIRTKPDRTYDDISQSDFSAEGGHTPYLIRRVLQSKTEAKVFEAFIKRVGKSSGLFETIQIRKYGEAYTAPFEVDAVLDGKPLNLLTVGYGVSQSLPVVVEIITRPKGSWFAIQQPEVHLHPRAQAALGDAFFEMAVGDDKRFLIETHSDFTIDRFRMNYRRRGKKPNSQVLFFERKHKTNTVTPLVISAKGELPSEQPDGYRRFFVKEEMRVLGL